MISFFYFLQQNNHNENQLLKASRHQAYRRWMKNQPAKLSETLKIIKVSKKNCKNIEMQGYVDTDWVRPIAYPYITFILTFSLTFSVDD